MATPHTYGTFPVFYRISGKEGGDRRSRWGSSNYPVPLTLSLQRGHPFFGKEGDVQECSSGGGNRHITPSVGCADTLIKLDPFDCAKPRMRDIAVLLRLG